MQEVRTCISHLHRLKAARQEKKAAEKARKAAAREATQAERAAARANMTEEEKAANRKAHQVRGLWDAGCVG